MRKKFMWLSLSPWVILACLAMLGPMAYILTARSIHRDKENMTRLLVEKGAALIRSFEAGARTGMTGMGWGAMQIQRLLVETAQQSDILYLVVVDDQGMAMAHSNTDKIGKPHSAIRPGGIVLPDESPGVHWQLVPTGNGETAFEVYKRFAPTGGTRRPGSAGRRDLLTRRQHFPRNQDEAPCQPGQTGQTDWSRFYRNPKFAHNGPDHYIFVGLDMSALESSMVEARRRTILMSMGLGLVAFAGIVSLFLAQSYRLTRRSLAKVRAFSDQVVEKLPVGLVASDENSRVAAYNETAEAILGIKSADALGQDAADSLPPELWSLSGRMDAEGPVIEEDLECAAGRDASLPLRVSAARLHGEDRSFWGYVYIFRDLSEVRRLQREVERSKRLAALGNLAAGVAHEIRNPLSSIKGFATYFRDRFKDQPKDQDTARTMIQEVERLDRVIGQLLEFARPSDLKVTPVNVPELIKHALKLVEGDAGARDVVVTSDIAPDLEPVYMDPDRMSQVLLNLYLNAIQAMDHGGKMEIRVTRDEKRKQTKVAVSDSGPGIDPTDLERIFDPYFTTKPGGTGLGLAIVHKILEAHGGDVQVRSEQHKGTTVTLVLPDLGGIK